MCRTVGTRLRCETASVPLARAWAVDALRRLYVGLDRDLVGDTALVVSELVTNCVNAGTRVLGVSLELHRGGIVVSTTDDAPGTPEVPHVTPDDPHGRGLMIVAATAKEWGVDRIRGEKIVWALLGIHDEVELHFACTQAI